jgi:predicted nucleic acid-binding protein
MIVYGDTSALVKLFVEEKNSERTREMLSRAQALGTGLLTRAELGAALARGVRRGFLSAQDALEARRRLDRAWTTWVHIAVDESLVSRAEDLAWEYSLRGYDAVHLAAALAWQERLNARIVVATFDRELWQAARQSELEAWPEA